MAKRYFTGQVDVVDDDGRKSKLTIITVLKSQHPLNAGDYVFRALELAAVERDLVVVDGTEEFAPATSHEQVAFREYEHAGALESSEHSEIQWVSLVTAQ